MYGHKSNVMRESIERKSLSGHTDTLQKSVLTGEFDKHLLLFRSEELFVANFPGDMAKSTFITTETIAGICGETDMYQMAGDRI